MSGGFRWASPRGSAPPAARGHAAHSTRWGALALGALFAWSLLFQIRFLDEKLLLGDEGVAVMDAWRISQGQVPHRDFFEIVPPFSFLPTALVFKLFGVGVLQERLLALFYGLLLVLLADRLVARFGASVWARCLPAALLTAFGVSYWPVPSHHWVVDLLQLGAALALLSGLDAPRPLCWGLLAGALTGLAGFSLQDQGLYFAAAVALFVLPWVPAEGGRRRMLGLAWLAGLGSTALAFAFYLLPAVSPVELLHQWVLFPASRYRGIPGNATGPLAGWEMVRALWGSGAWVSRPLFNLALTASLALTFSLPLAAVAGLAAAAWGRRWSGARLGVLWALAAAGLGAAAHRWSLTNLVWAGPLLVPALAAGLNVYEGEGVRSRLRVAARCVAAGAAAVFTLFSALYAIGDPALKTTPIVAPAGSLRSTQQAEAPRLQETLDAIGRFVPRGAPLFCNGYLPMVNFLALRPNPTRFNFFFHPAYHTDAQAAEVVATLAARRDAWVLLAYPLEPRATVEAFVLREYDLVWRNSRCALFGPSRRPGEKAP